MRKSLKQVGKGFRFGPNCQFNDHRLISIGDDVFFGDRSIINTIVPVTVGNKVMFGPSVSIMGGDHNFSIAGKAMKDVHSGGKNEEVVIENDTWIGTNTIILKGVRVREGAVVGAGSLVTKSVLPYSLNMGSPARFVRCRFDQEQLKFHLQELSSDYSIKQIVKLYKDAGLDIPSAAKPEPGT